MLARIAACCSTALFGIGVAVAAPAVALPGDPPVAPLAPEDGQTLPVDPDGIAVRFACPPYTAAPATPPFTTPVAGLVSDYGAAMSSAPGLGADGRLTGTDGIGAVAEVVPGTCEARLGSGGFPKPQLTPGTWYWQAWRACSGCESGWETSPVRRFVLAADTTLALRAPARAYLGYPFVVALEVTGAAQVGGVVLERRAGSGWVRVAAVDDGADAAIVALPRGAQQLRARVAAGDLASPPVRVAVGPARRWTTSGRDDGAYRDPRRPSVRLRVGSGGRRLSGFHADVPTQCSSTTSPTGIAPGLSTVDLPPVRIAPDGRFAVAGTYRGTRVRLTGRLHGRALSGTRVAVAAAACAGSIAVQARRAGAA